MTKILIPAVLDFAANFLCCEAQPIILVQNDYSAYFFDIEAKGLDDDQVAFAVVSYGEETATLPVIRNGDCLLCELPPLPEGGVSFQFGRTGENIRHRLPQTVSGKVIPEYPDGVAPEPQKSALEILLRDLTIAYSESLELYASVQSMLDAGAFNGAQGEKGDKGDTGEQGIQGMTGITGAKGDKGLPGADGRDGKSAYQSALDGGFPDTRTEEQFNSDLAVVHEKQEKLPIGKGTFLRDWQGDIIASGEKIHSSPENNDYFTLEKRIDMLKDDDYHYSHCLLEEIKHCGDVMDLKSRYYLSAEATNSTNRNALSQIELSSMSVDGSYSAFDVYASITVGDSNVGSKDYKFTPDGLSMANGKIKNLANGMENNDAVNVSQLNQKATLIQATDETDALTQSTNEPNNLYWW